MTMTEIMKAEINNELSLLKTWREYRDRAETEEEAVYYLGCISRSRDRAEAKAELAQALGYTVLYSEDRDECISIYSMELDD